MKRSGPQVRSRLALPKTFAVWEPGSEVRPKLRREESDFLLLQNATLEAEFMSVTLSELAFTSIAYFLYWSFFSLSLRESIFRSGVIKAFCR